MKKLFKTSVFMFFITLFLIQALLSHKIITTIKIHINVSLKYVFGLSFLLCVISLIIIYYTVNTKPKKVRKRYVQRYKK